MNKQIGPKVASADACGCMLDGIQSAERWVLCLVQKFLLYVNGNENIHVALTVLRNFQWGRGICQIGTISTPPSPWLLHHVDASGEPQATPAAQTVAFLLLRHDRHCSLGGAHSSTASRGASTINGPHVERAYRSSLSL